MAQSAKYYYKGKEYTLQELYKQCIADIPFLTFKSRIDKGWDVEIALLLGNAKSGKRKYEYRHYWTHSTIFCYKHKGDCANCTIMPEDMKYKCRAKYIIPKILEHYGAPNYDNFHYVISTGTKYDVLNSIYEVKELLSFPPEKQQELLEFWQNTKFTIQNEQEKQDEFYRVLRRYLNTCSISEATRQTGISRPVIFNVKIGKKIKLKAVIEKAEKFLQDNNLYELYKEETC